MQSSLHFSPTMLDSQRITVKGAFRISGVHASGGRRGYTSQMA